MLSGHGYTESKDTANSHEKVANIVQIDLKTTNYLYRLC